MPLETIEICPVCNSTSFSNYLNVEDYTVSHKEFKIQQCNHCYFLLTNPRPDEASIGEYYESSDYISHHDDTTSLMSKVYVSVRDYTIKKKLEMIGGLLPKKGTILDIGCGTGNFIQACKQNGWSVSATEPDSEARKTASERVGESVTRSIFDPKLAPLTFDIITMWHVLEHVHQLNETIGWLRNHLNPGGKIIIAVPNPESYDALKYGKYWAAYDVPRHLYHFTKNVMKQLMGKHALQVEAIKPMWFDSFYVSMLSTKYKKIGILDSIKTGLISNLKAIPGNKKTTNTSSLIYIISKQ